MKYYFYPLAFLLIFFCFSACEKENKCEQSAYIPSLPNWSITELSIPPSLSINGFNIIDVCFVDQDLGYISKRWEGIFRTTDGGKYFKSVNVNVPQNYISRKISFIDANTGFIEVDSAGPSPFVYGPIGLCKTTDGGNTWQFIRTNLTGIFTYLKFFTPTQAIATIRASSNSFPRVVYTVDGGTTWLSASQNTGYSSNIKFYNDKLYIINNYKLISSSSDRGITWASVFQLPDPYWLIDYEVVNGVGLFFTSRTGLFFMDSAGNISQISENPTHLLFFKDDKYGLTIQKSWACNPTQDTTYLDEEFFAEGVRSFSSLENMNLPMNESEPSVQLKYWNTYKIDDKTAICWEWNSAYLVKYTK